MSKTLKNPTTGGEFDIIVLYPKKLPSYLKKSPLIINPHGTVFFYFINNILYHHYFLNILPFIMYSYKILFIFINIINNNQFYNKLYIYKVDHILLPPLIFQQFQLV